jgi:hypothetical protein
MFIKNKNIYIISIRDDTNSRSVMLGKYKSIFAQNCS